MRTCNRCQETMKWPQSCWYCGKDMCLPCWEAHGHCGHAEAEAINEASRKRGDPAPAPTLN